MIKQPTTLFFIGLMIFTVHEGQAQELRFGAKGGLSWYTLKIETGTVDLTQNSKLGFALGGFAIYPVSDIFSFQPEALFMQKNGEEFWGVTAKLTYIELPLLARVNIPAEASFSPFLLAGPSVGFLLNASLSDNGGDASDLYTTMNMGISLGAGAAFGNINIDIRYDLGLVNIDDFADAESDSKYSTRGLLLTAGYLFN